MMTIEIKPVLRTDHNYSMASDISLPNIAETKALVEQSLLCHPLNKRGVSRNISIIMNITVGGADYYSMLPWASINYYSYLLDRHSPIILNFHLAKYWGADSSFVTDAPELGDILLREINFPALQCILYHEFTHLLDAIDPDFKYDSSIREQLRKTEQAHKIIVDLWNAYIDRRLVHLLEHQYEKHIQPTKNSSNSSVDDLLRTIWSSNTRYTFLQLMQMAQRCCNV